MDLSFFNTKNLFEASYHFFNQTLAVPTTQAITKQKLSLKDVLRDDVYKLREPFIWVTETYFLGTIDESAFEKGALKTNFEDAKKSKYESILLFSLQIESDKTPTKSQLAELTRALNRSSLDKPVMVLFKYGDYLTYATSERTEYQRKHLQGEKIGKISLLKDIYIPKPHAGHERILFELTVNPLETINYTELYEKWQKVFDLQILNKTFYHELFYWYLWAIRLVKFPKPADDKNDDHTHASISVIRLLTRLIFVWFVKEKRLIPEELFSRKTLQKILKEFIPESEMSSNYYKAILQNLFFATLNTEMNKDNPGSRKFIAINKSPQGQSDDYINHLVYRYRELFQNEDDALKLFENIPFLNGGLFECLDFVENVKGRNIEKRYDGFSTKREKQPFVPNILFFGNDPDVDLSQEFGDNKKFKHEKVRGIIEILSSYKFTITENTPLEEEIALDPELLGKVFENLLASYNPETQTTARKQTGSFYTPREIVNYMVDESIKAYLIQQLSSKYEIHEETHIDKMDLLFLYGTSDNPFDSDSSLNLIDFISNCRILDPACGSGAFPMGALHRMVHLLGKLDPNNIHWKNAQLQKAKQDLELAMQMKVPEIREKAIESAELRIEFIKESFASNHHELDYTRKLFLIENCIYGVDIQQIAVQISKLRFFISLIVDQKVIDSKHNRNILSMPNLETKFVAANTLIPIDRPDGMIINPTVEKYEKELHEIRQRIFFTKRYRDKKGLKKEEETKRSELKDALVDSGFGEISAQQMATWNPFDPINSATFFDPLTMFGFEDGFQIIIGNPPYVNIKEQSPEIKTVIKSKYKFAKGADIYVAFIEKGLSLLQHNSTLTYIVPNKFFGADYGKALRNHLEFGDVSIQSIWDLKDEKVFENALISTIVLSIMNSKETSITKLIQNDTISFMDNLFDETGKIQIEANEKDTTVLNQMKKRPKLAELADIRTGVMGFEYWKMEPIIQEGHHKNSVKIYTNGNLLRYKDQWASTKIKLYKKEYSKPCIGLNPEYLNSNTIELFLKKPKIIVRGVSKEIAAIIDNDGSGLLVAVHSIIPNKVDIKYLLGVINSRPLNWFHLHTIYSIRIPQGSLKYPISFFDSLPIPCPNKLIQQKIGAIVDFILTMKEYNNDTTFFEKLIDAMVYELFFPESIQTAESEVIKRLPPLPELKDNLEQEKQLKTIITVLNELSNPKHPVSISMKKIQNVEEVKIIESQG